MNDREILLLANFINNPECSTLSNALLTGIYSDTQ